MFVLKSAYNQPGRWLRTTVVTLFVLSFFIGGAVFAKRTRTPVKQMSFKQQVNKAEKYIEGMKQVLKSAFVILKDARERQDIQKLNGVNEALSAIKGLLRLSEQNLTMLQEAVAKNDQQTAEHEFVKISIAYNKIRELDARIKSLSRPSTGGSVDGHGTDVTVIKSGKLHPKVPHETAHGPNQFRNRGHLLLPFEQRQQPTHH